MNARMEVLNPTLLQLSWEPPFSWEEYPLQHYNVMVEDTTNNEVLKDEMVELSTGGSTVTYELDRDTQAESCVELVFTVTASNVLGQSSPAVITGGFPIGGYDAVVIAIIILSEAKPCQV